jgi:hypothetical protein
MIEILPLRLPEENLKRALSLRASKNCRTRNNSPCSSCGQRQGAAIAGYVPCMVYILKVPGPGNLKSLGYARSR